MLGVKLAEPPFLSELYVGLGEKGDARDEDF